MTFPDSLAGSSSPARRRSAWGPTYSHPWTPPVTTSVLPRAAPHRQIAFRGGASGTGSGTFFRSPGKSVVPQKIIRPRIIKTISKGVVLIISPSFKKLYRRSSYLPYNQNKHCGFVSIRLQLRLFGGDSNRSGLSELVISWVTLDVSFA